MVAGKKMIEIYRVSSFHQCDSSMNAWPQSQPRSLRSFVVRFWHGVDQRSKRFGLRSGPVSPTQSHNATRSWQLDAS